MGDDDEAPKPKDITVCFKCAAILEFTEDLNVQFLTQETMDNVPVNQLYELLFMARKIKQFWAEQN